MTKQKKRDVGKNISGAKSVGVDTSKIGVAFGLTDKQIVVSTSEEPELLQREDLLEPPTTGLLATL